MNNLLLGSTGWIGGHVMNHRPTWKWKGISSADYDLENQTSTDKITGTYDNIIHAAGFFGGLPFNKKHEKNILYKNMVMNMNVCRLVSKIRPKKFVVIGSACLYPPQGNSVLREDTIGQSTFHPSVKFSAMAKLNLLQMLEVLGIDFEYLVVSNAYGPGEHISDEKSHIIGSLIKKVQTAKHNLHMIGTGVGIRDYIYIDDVAEAVCRYCELDKTTNRPTNISNSVGITVKEIVATVMKHSKKNLKPIWGDPNDNGVLCKVLDNSKMKSDINFVPKIGIDEGLLRTWEWFNA